MERRKGGRKGTAEGEGKRRGMGIMRERTVTVKAIQKREAVHLEEFKCHYGHKLS